jgi:drug/metabolite transporter (DMT)-like permease
MRPTASPSSLAVWTGLVILYVVWGSTFLGMKLAIDTIPPFLAIGFRFIPAGLLLGLFVAVRGRGTVRRPSPVEVRDASIVGALLLLCGTGLVAWAVQTVTIGIAAILIALVPMWIAIIGRVLYGERLPTMATIGIGVGLVGVAILAWPTGGVGDLDPAGLLALIVSPILWAIGTHYAAKRAVLPEPALLGSSIQMFTAGIGCILVGALIGELDGFDVGAVTALSWGGVLYLITMGSFVGYTTYAWLIRVAPLSRVSTYAYVNPVVAVILGWLVLSEPRRGRGAGRGARARGLDPVASDLVGRRTVTGCPIVHGHETRAGQRRVALRAERPASPTPARHRHPLRGGAASLLVRHGGPKALAMPPAAA